MTDSRWVAQFQGHAFRAHWATLKEILETAEVDDKSVPASVQELARLKRVVSYLDLIIEKIDPEITPKQTWDQFSSQLTPCLNSLQQYLSNKNVNHLTQANEHADNLLAYVRPYMVLPAEALSALKKSTSTYAQELENQLISFRNDANKHLREIEANRKEVISDSAAVRKNKNRIGEYVKLAIEDSEDAPSIKQRIDSLLIEIEKKSVQMNDLHGELLTGTDKQDALALKVRKAAVDVGENQAAIAKALSEVKESVADLKEFYATIFGEINKNTGEKEGGLRSELQERTAALTQLENEQKTKHKALFERIESLLPGANSAGLATAYKVMKEGFENPIKLYTELFYGSLLLLVLGAAILSIDSISWPLSVKFVDIPQWDTILRALMFKVPFVAPVVWLALFSSTRRSQYERLQQEYAHKEALAKSYDSYKKQLQELKDDSDDLLKELLANAIKAISFNASITLDGKHESKLPTQQLLENLSGEDLSKLAKKIFDMMPKKAQ